MIGWLSPIIRAGTGTPDLINKRDSETERNPAMNRTDKAQDHDHGWQGWCLHQRPRGFAILEPSGQHVRGRGISGKGQWWKVVTVPRDGDKQEVAGCKKQIRIINSTLNSIQESLNALTWRVVTGTHQSAHTERPF